MTRDERLQQIIAILRDGKIIQQGTSQDIVLRPADAYIESFVREVNRGRVIRADAAMEPASGPLPEVSVEGDCTLEDAGRLMVKSRTTRLAVRDGATGRITGTLSMEGILAAITQRAQERS